ncbi:hypothetical protein H9N28_07150 [Rhodobacter capsulatus]|uniref:Uncharacterized protein n=1 Tax=Rhodobacter capsulatus TaxID=1061 RepID=A0A1G7H0K0_RHOCA|nr:hypothetical protein [Rhodobacter capsulatus]KQB17109.1 hypothetical protein AP073_00230 [Rhodobacter capsulatus]PZX27520.1 hypothetical protein LY44_00896 [Rhodobacter capsulatus]QNR64591.1 hypothetical protein H9N28_07150 [Rhodobacter capsulatus]WER07609.1 hypothetical protein PUH89_09610 [Rhodobacter capsulatus]SDE93946.1 hypothetical protein SAMN04244550_01363 [Rhodobacter capsulatus]
MSELVVLDVTVSRILGGLNAYLTAKRLARFLDAGDRDGATAEWRRRRAEAERQISSKVGVPEPIRAEVLRRYCGAVREEIVKLRGSAAIGIENRTKSDDGRPVAKILAFPTRTDPLPVPSFAAWNGPTNDPDEWARWSAREMFGGDA